MTRIIATALILTAMIANGGAFTPSSTARQRVPCHGSQLLSNTLIRQQSTRQQSLSSTSNRLIIGAITRLYEHPNQHEPQSTTDISRRVWLKDTLTSLALGLTTVAPRSALAKEPKLDPATAREKILFELDNAQGGIAFLQDALTRGDTKTVLEFTKSYDTVLRKAYMGAVKKTLADGDKATALSNAVTFDLIGINKASRPGQVSGEQAQKYLDELKADVRAFLDLSVAAVEK
jgi:hypothetical protein